MTIIRKSDRGFTLIELLVVIAIIAVLAAILFPIFVSAKQAAYTAKCQSNLRQLGMAIAQYLSDNAGRFPFSGLHFVDKAHTDLSPGNDARTAWGTFYGFFPPESAPKLDQYTPNVRFWVSGMYRYIKDRNVVWCPSDPQKDKLKRRGAWVNNTDWCWASYNWKCAVDTAWFAGTTGGPPGTPARRDSDYAFPTKQSILYERMPFHDADPLWAKEGSKTVFLFIDGHVATKLLKNVCWNANDPRFGNGPYNGHGYPSNPEGGAGEPAWYNARVGGGGFVKSPQPWWDPRIYYDKL